MPAGPEQKCPYSSGRHSRYGFYVFHGLVLHIEKQDSRPFSVREGVYGKIQFLVRESLVGGIVGNPVIRHLPDRQAPAFLPVAKAVISYPEKPRTESGTSLKARI